MNYIQVPMKVQILQNGDVPGLDVDVYDSINQHKIKFVQSSFIDAFVDILTYE